MTLHSLYVVMIGHINKEEIYFCCQSLVFSPSFLFLLAHLSSISITITYKRAWKTFFLTDTCNICSNDFLFASFSNETHRVDASTMNTTGDVRCENCLLSHGFSSAERRSIIVMVVLTGLALIACFVVILWYGIRTRFISEKTGNIVVQNNDVYQPEDDTLEDYNPPIDNPRQAATTTTTTLSFAPDVNSVMKDQLRSV